MHNVRVKGSEQPQPALEKGKENETHSLSNPALRVYLDVDRRKRNTPLVVRWPPLRKRGRLHPTYKASEMTSQEFLDWMGKIGIHKAVEIKSAIGVSRNTAQMFLKHAKAGDDVPINQTVALAMSARAAGLPAWGTRKGKDNDT